MDCCTGVNGLWIWPLCDGAVVPACNTALVKGEPASQDETHLPPTVEAVLEHGELLAMMHRVLWTALFLICVDLAPFVILVSIIVKMKTVIDVSEGHLQHGFHAPADRVKWLAGQPSTSD